MLEVSDSQGDPDAAEAILDERGGARGQYLIKWSSIDPKTGEVYVPTWEAKSGASLALLMEWLETKKTDPSVIGVEGARLKEEKKRRREEKSKMREERERADLAQQEEAPTNTTGEPSRHASISIGAFPKCSK